MGILWVLMYFVIVDCVVLGAFVGLICGVGWFDYLPAQFRFAGWLFRLILRIGWL